MYLTCFVIVVLVVFVLLLLCPNRWFDGFYWWGLQNRSLEPPIMPCVRSVIDTNNFDDYPPDPEAPPPDDLTDWDKHF